MECGGTITNSKNQNKIYTTKSCDLNEGPMKAAKRILKNPRTNRNKKPFFETAEGKRQAANQIRTLATNNQPDEYEHHYERDIITVNQQLEEGEIIE